METSKLALTNFHLSILYEYDDDDDNDDDDVILPTKTLFSTMQIFPKMITEIGEKWVYKFISCFPKDIFIHIIGSNHCNFSKEKVERESRKVFV